MGIPGGSEKVEGRFSLPTKNLFQYSRFRGQRRKLHIPYLGKWQLPQSPEDVFFSAFAQCRNAHANSNSSGLPKKGTFSSINTALKNNSLTSRRSLQSIAQTKDVKGRRRHAINDAIDVGAKNIASDPCLSSVTLGELREAKYLSQKLQEKIMRWIWEGESWSVFAENDIQITR